MNLLELAERCEKAEADEQRTLLIAAFNLCFPWEGGGDQSRAYAEYWDRHARFIAMLNAEAYESAALTLVPDGWSHLIDSTTGKWIVELFPPDHDRNDWHPNTRIQRAANASFALALTAAAALRAHHAVEAQS